MQEHVSLEKTTTLIGLCLAVFVAQADSSVVNLALYKISEDFDGDISSLQWIINAYNLLYATALLSGGFLADMLGRKIVFLFGMVVLIVSSLLCALAPSLELLITFRAIAGVSSALIIPSSMAIVALTWPEPIQRSRALSLWIGTNGLALAVAPTLGGWLVSTVGWRSIFYAVIPFCIASMLFIQKNVKNSKEINNRREFKIPEQLLFLLTVFLFTYSATIIKVDLYRALFCALISFLGLIISIRVSHKKGQTALIPLSFFKEKDFRISIFGSTAMTFGMYGLLFILPLFWQSRFHFTALVSGVNLIPMALAFMLTTFFSGKILSFLGYYLSIIIGLVFIASGILLIAFCYTSFIVTWIGLGATGVGMGIASGPLMTIGVSAVNENKPGLASSIINSSRMLGATLGVALFGTVFSFADENYKVELSFLIGFVVQFIFLIYIIWVYYENKKVKKK